MDATTTPRRALAPLDANKMSPALSKLKSSLGLGKSPVKTAVIYSEARKRPLEASEEVVVVKRTCVEMESKSVSVEDKPSVVEGKGEKGREEQIDRDQSASPDASSLFDNSAFETHNTTVTEPDLAEASRPARLTREQTRKMADDLKARLRLANYKLKTGQTLVPFTQLEARAIVFRQRQIHPLPTVQVHRPSSSSQPEEEQPQDKGVTTEGDESVSSKGEAQKGKEREGEGAGSILPPLVPSSDMLTPRKGVSVRDVEKLTSSGLRGGAASGLLRLSQGAFPLE